MKKLTKKMQRNYNWKKPSSDKYKLKLFDAEEIKNIYYGLTKGQEREAFISELNKFYIIWTWDKLSFIF